MSQAIDIEKYLDDLPPSGELSYLPEGFHDALSQLVNGSLESDESSEIAEERASMGMLRHILSNDSDLQSDLYGFSRSLTEYCRNGDFADVVFIDRSARLARVGMKQYWNLAYPGDTLPDMHFMSPGGARIQEGGSFFSNMVASFGRNIVEKRAAKQLKASQSTLLAKKDQPVLLVDACLHTGNTFKYARDVLGRVGIHDVYAAVYCDTEESDAVASSDFAYTRAKSEITCSPFARDMSIDNILESVYSLRYIGSPDIASDRIWRNQIRTIVQNGFQSEKTQVKN
jgi:hypothetical protein